MSDLYSLLGVRRDATSKMIKKAYHKAALELHPDKLKERSEEATERFQQIIDAYTVLSNEITRKEYDDNLAAKEAEMESLSRSSDSRKEMINELEVKERIANGQKVDLIKPYRENLNEAMQNIKTDEGSFSFKEYEKIILNTLLNM